MSAIADCISPGPALSMRRRTGHRIPIWLWVVGSRLTALLAGSWGALFTHPLAGWQRYDPQRLSTSLGSVGNVLGAASVRWDSIEYLTIARHGYTNARSTVYFPLYPLLIRLLTIVVRSPVIAGELISLVAFGIALMLTHRLVDERIGRRTADATVLLIAFSPISFVFSALYTESLLFALLAGSFYLAHRGLFAWACVVAAAAAVTHIQGILMVAPLALIYWRSHAGAPRGPWPLSGLALSLPPLALGGLFLYMHLHGWGWLAPITNQSAEYAGRTLVGPPITVFDSVRDGIIELNQQFHGSGPARSGFLAPGAQNLVYLALLVIAVCALISVWRRMPPQYALFGGLALLVCTSSAVAREPLQGFDRYLLPIFPLWIGAAAWIEKRKLTPLVLAASSALLVVNTIGFTRWFSVF